MRFIFFQRPKPTPPLSIYEQTVLGLLGSIDRRLIQMKSKADEILELANQLNTKTNEIAALEEADAADRIAANARLQAIYDQIVAGQSPTLDGIKQALEATLPVLNAAAERSAANAAVLRTWGQDPANPFPTTPPPPPAEPT